MRSHADARRWMQAGSSTLLELVTGLSEAAYDEPCLLPGWTRRHLVAHVAANADALRNLVHWASTGEETPMYASPEERAAGIERGSRLPAADVTDWLRRGVRDLESDMAGLANDRWRAEVVTAQGRTVPATEIPWMRAREVLVHVVDLDRGVGFADLAEDFLTALVEDISTKRGLDPAGLPPGPLAEQAAWLAGRPHTLDDAPRLDAWL